MEYLSLMLGSLATNCYLLKLGDGKCVIVDIGEGAPVLLCHSADARSLRPHCRRGTGAGKVSDPRLPPCAGCPDAFGQKRQSGILDFRQSVSGSAGVADRCGWADTHHCAKRFYPHSHTGTYTGKRLLEMRGSAADGGHVVPYVTWQNGFPRRKRCPDAGIFPKTQGVGGGLPCTAGTQRGIHALL